MIELNEKHEYTVNKKKVPGVSEILTHFGFNDFSMVPYHILQPAINFGNVVHEVIRLSESLDTEGFNDSHKKIQKHWHDFRNYVKLENCVVDIKTFAKPKTSNILQLFGYKILIENQPDDSPFSSMEKLLFSNTWNFCGKPDFYFMTEKIKKLYILTIPNLNGFDPKKNVFTYDAIKDVKWENEFKSLLKVYQIQKKEGII